MCKVPFLKAVEHVFAYILKNDWVLTVNNTIKQDNVMIFFIFNVVIKKCSRPRDKHMTEQKKTK